MDSYRVNRYNITEKKVYTNRLIQGGQRYQKLNLSTSGDLVLTAVGIKLSEPKLPIEDIPGKFECSDESLNNVWTTGARTIQRTEIKAGTTPEFYEISEQGLLYDLTFQAKPLKGGFGYTVLSDTLGNGIYVLVDVENLSIAAYAGSTELGRSPLAKASLDSESVSLNAWHEVHTQVNVTDITVTINGATALDLSQTSSFYGSFGLGASFQRKALYQNVTLSSNGDEILKSSLTSKADLDYFLAGTNPLSVSVDGARRDRIAYSGDLEMAVRTAFATTYGIEYLNGTFNLLGSFQLTPGYFVPTVKIQQSPRTEPIDANVTGLIGYSFNLVSAMGEYYMLTGDAAFARRWGPAARAMLDWAHSQSSGPTGLFNVTDAAFGGDWDYYDPAQTGAVSKFNAAYACALQAAVPMLSAGRNGSTDAALYAGRLAALRRAMNAHLWTADLGAYALSTTDRSAFVQDANALAILAGVPPSANATARLLRTMRAALLVPAGALAFSPAASPRRLRSISPYASGHHLRAALAGGDRAAAAHLLRRLYAPMADPAAANHTGCFWEALTEAGAPGLGPATSLCHAWGAAAAGELSRSVLGVRPVRPGFAEWAVRPVRMGLGWARGRQVTPAGPIDVEWAVDGRGRWGINVTSPAGTVGKVYVPDDVVAGGGLGYEVNGVRREGSVFEVEGGGRFVLRQL
ncbi:putative alpha-L-rhamnosidase C [Neofusicoccum parvum]|uniref:Alpha-L-rhamnosidase C n=1 Tax=Neofusicoccum parvum TaxID=310453 RepID=A0ACB5S878_9PEZI|nr:putative alpha-L-rhamnosidase C [Neofusicoccum parvum]